MAKRSASQAEEGPWWAQEKPEDVFSSLLGSTISSKDFFAKYWEKEPLIISNGSAKRDGKLTQLFSREALDRILKKERIDFGLHLNSCRYVDGSREGMNPDENEETGEPARATAKRVWKLFDGDRATLQFHQPQQFQDSLWRLCSALESYFGCLVGSNVYMTPSESQGLAPHHDDVEVFIVQLEGRKHWRLYSPLDKLARSCSKDLEPADIGEATHDIILEAGDVMYFPRGTIHQADTPAGVAHSTHITISTYQNWTYGELLQIVMPFALDAALKDTSALAFRKGLPLNVMSAAGTGQETAADQRCGSAAVDVRDTLTALVQQLTKYISPSPAIDLLNTDFLRSRLPPPPPVSKDQAAADAPKRKKSKGSKSEDVDVIDLTSGTGIGDPVGSQPTATSKVCLLHRSHIRVVVGRGLEDDEDPDMDMMDDEFDDDSDADGSDGEQIDDVNGGDNAGDADAMEDSALGMDSGTGFLVGDDGGDDDNDDDDDENKEDACYVHVDFNNVRRMHMTNIAGHTPALSSVKLSLSAVPAIGKLLSQLTPIAISDLGLDEEAALELATGLWASGLLSAH